MIRKIWADNYKSLRNFELELRPFNVLVGANASGKSNILDVLSFVQDCVVHLNGVAAAVTNRNGWRGITTAPESSDVRTRIGFSLVPAAFDQGLTRNDTTTKAHHYELVLMVSPPRVWIAGERLTTDGGTLDPSHVVFEREWNNIRLDDGKMSIPFADEASLLADDLLALESYSLKDRTVLNQIANWQFLDIQPDAARIGTADRSTRHLARDGGNLAALLAALDSETHENVRDALHRDVPGFGDFHIEEAAGRVFFTVDEEHGKRLPPASVSDGTILLLALYTLYYSQNHSPLVCIEEPERGLHPDLIETVVEYLRAMSERTQVIVTTHSPLIVDWCKPEEVVLLEKVDGATRAMRVPDRKQIEHFLKDWTLGELWTREFLDEIVHNGVRAGSPG